MSSIGDSSQISDLSGISHISRSSGIRPLGKVDNTLGISECRASSTIRESTNRLTSRAHIGNASKTLRLMKLISACEDAMSEYAKLKLLHDCLEEAAHSDTMQTSVATTLRSIITTQHAGEYLRLPTTEKNNQGDSSLLGIMNVPKFHLTRNEKSDISIAVERIFLERMNYFIESYEKSGGKMAEILKTHESAGKSSLLESHETDLMRWNDPMNEACTEYYRDLLTFADLLSQWQRLKYIEMKELNMKNAENLLLQAQVAEVQAEISRKTCALRMFNETPRTIDAFGILSDSLDARIHDAREKIQKRKALRMNYADVSGKDYDKLLNKYTELCAVIRKKEHLMEMFSEDGKSTRNIIY